MDMKQTPQTEDDWRERLTPEQYRVLREAGTEPAFTGKYYDEHAPGMYHCAACGAELFSSDAKFESGTGWPSFTEAANRENVTLHTDTSHGVTRVEVRCKKCDGHLGHVFDDLPRDKAGLPRGKAGGPGKEGKRFCINSACLDLKKRS